MNKFLQHQILYEKDTRYEDTINLNAETLDFDVSTSPFKKRRARILGNDSKECCFVEDKKYPADQCESFHQWVTAINDDDIGDIIWIMHHVPSFLELKAKHLRKNFAGEVDLDHDMISLMMRCFKQADDAAMSILFWSAENITWRPIW